jgi:hypothetical protein
MAGDNLIFPDNETPRTSTNDFPADTTFGSILVEGGNYQVQNNAIRSSTLTVQGNAVLTVASIICDTLIIGSTPDASSATESSISDLSIANEPRPPQGSPEIKGETPPCTPDIDANINKSAVVIAPTAELALPVVADSVSDNTASDPASTDAPMQTEPIAVDAVYAAISSTDSETVSTSEMAAPLATEIPSDLPLSERSNADYSPEAPRPIELSVVDQPGSTNERPEMKGETPPQWLDIAANINNFKTMFHGFRNDFKIIDSNSMTSSSIAPAPLHPARNRAQQTIAPDYRDLVFAEYSELLTSRHSRNQDQLIKNATDQFPSGMDEQWIDSIFFSSKPHDFT